jgi:hypothetical protein
LVMVEASCDYLNKDIHHTGIGGKQKSNTFHLLGEHVLPFCHKTHSVHYIVALNLYYLL